jgi:hypothetical protein
MDVIKSRRQEQSLPLRESLGQYKSGAVHQGQFRGVL